LLGCVIELFEPTFTASHFLTVDVFLARPSVDTAGCTLVLNFSFNAWRAVCQLDLFRTEMHRKIHDLRENLPISVLGYVC
jgi:hypothetical protein